MTDDERLVWLVERVESELRDRPSPLDELPRKVWAEGPHEDKESGEYWVVWVQWDVDEEKLTAHSIWQDVSSPDLMGCDVENMIHDGVEMLASLEGAKA